ncbi:MAG TPA: polymer-forming cytoskeletal protein [Phycisphaerae bacterium]
MPAVKHSVASPGDPGRGAPSRTDGKVILCTYCDQPQEVGRKAQTITCRFCYKRLNLEDAHIKQYEAHRAIETCGSVLIDKKGTVVAERLHCASLTVRGKLKANVISRGAVQVATTAEIRGDVAAPRIAIDAGAVLEGRYHIGSA